MIKFNEEIYNFYKENVGSPLLVNGNKIALEKDWVNLPSRPYKEGSLYAVKPKSNILIIDVDIKGGKQGVDSLKRLERDLSEILYLNELELLPNVVTPSGGLHIYVKIEFSDSFRKIQKNYPDIDFIQSQHYALCGGQTISQGSYKINHFDIIEGLEFGLNQVLDHRVKSSDEVKDELDLLIGNDISLSELETLIEYQNDDEYHTWIRNASIIKRCSIDGDLGKSDKGFNLWFEWSKNSNGYEGEPVEYYRSKWDSLDISHGGYEANIGTLVHEAREEKVKSLNQTIASIPDLEWIDLNEFEINEYPELKTEHKEMILTTVKHYFNESGLKDFKKMLREHDKEKKEDVKEEVKKLAIENMQSIENLDLDVDLPSRNVHLIDPLTIDRGYSIYNDNVPLGLVEVNQNENFKHLKLSNFIRDTSQKGANKFYSIFHGYHVDSEVMDGHTRYARSFITKGKKQKVVTPPIKNITSSGILSNAYGYLYLPNQPLIVKRGVKKFINTFDERTLVKPNFNVESWDEEFKTQAHYLDKHLKIMLGEDESRHFKAICGYIAGVRKERLLYMTIVKGSKGLGKSVVFDILANILGRDNSRKIESKVLNNLDKFNYWCDGLHFTRIEELKVNGKDKEAIGNALKAPLTEKVLQIERKGQHPIEIDMVTNFVASTNYSDAIPMLDKDRRYCVFFADVDTNSHRVAFSDDGTASRGDELFTKYIIPMLDIDYKYKSELRAWLMMQVYEGFKHNKVPTQTGNNMLIDVNLENDSLEISQTINDIYGDFKEEFGIDVISKVIVGKAITARAETNNRFVSKALIGRKLEELGYMPLYKSKKEGCYGILYKIAGDDKISINDIRTIYLQNIKIFNKVEEDKKAIIDGFTID